MTDTAVFSVFVSRLAAGDSIERAIRVARRWAAYTHRPIPQHDNVFLQIAREAHVEGRRS